MPVLFNIFIDQPADSCCRRSHYLNKTKPINLPLLSRSLTTGHLWFNRIFHLLRQTFVSLFSSVLDLWPSTHPNPPNLLTDRPTDLMLVSICTGFCPHYCFINAFVCLNPKSGLRTTFCLVTSTSLNRRVRGSLGGTTNIYQPVFPALTQVFLRTFNPTTNRLTVLAD